ncbi:hypothetical protein Ocin01_14435 [Orchesella cincta]|uniref:Uncharacterized protein n=1 Tax=Orchesella cincta TaxID=48709 RepID=A0A1D2MGV8_ORCCI|nr:hypothetical protein Ocin01_14435 [Orchesella cincta]
MGARPSKHVEPPPTQDIVKEAITEDDNALRQQPQLTSELWQIILKDVEPEEFKILMDNCPQYKKELSSLAPSFLFPLLIRVLVKNGFLVENPLPILTYRLINSKVKAVIDSSLNGSPPPWLTDAFTFSDSTKIDEFIQISSRRTTYRSVLPFPTSKNS